VSANQLSTETPMFGQRNVIIIIPKHTPDRRTPIWRGAAGKSLGQT
jgi:hypothetical protein